MQKHLPRAFWLGVMRAIERLDVWWLMAIPRVTLLLGKLYDAAYLRAAEAERRDKWRHN